MLCPRLSTRTGAQRERSRYVYGQAREFWVLRQQKVTLFIHKSLEELAYWLRDDHDTKNLQQLLETLPKKFTPRGYAT